MTVTKGDVARASQIFTDKEEMLDFLASGNIIISEYYYKKTFVTGKLVYRNNTSSVRYVYNIIDCIYYTENIGAGQIDKRAALIAIFSYIDDYSKPSDPQLTLITEASLPPSGYSLYSFEGIIWTGD